MDKKYYATTQNKKQKKRVHNLHLRNKAFLWGAKDVPCADCGIKYPPYVMDFDHKFNKRFGIAQGSTRSLKSLAEEITKCDVVCSNCHRIRTYARLVKLAATAGLEPAA